MVSKPTNNPESGLDADETATLDGCVGKRIIAFSKAPNWGNFESGHWCDDEPLLLTLDDGSVLSLSAYGWHDSGRLGVELR